MIEGERPSQSGCAEVAAIAIFKVEDKILLQKLGKKRGQRLAALRLEDLSLRGRESREVEVYPEELEREVRKRIRKYGQVSRERNCIGILSPVYLDKLRVDVWNHIEAGSQVLKDRHLYGPPDFSPYRPETE